MDTAAPGSFSIFAPAARDAKQPCDDSTPCHARNAYKPCPQPSSGRSGLRIQHQLPPTPGQLRAFSDTTGQLLDRQQQQDVLSPTSWLVDLVSPLLHQRPTTSVHTSAPSWRSQPQPRHPALPGPSGGAFFAPFPGGVPTLWGLQRQPAWCDVRHQPGFAVQQQRAGTPRYTPAAGLRCVQLKIFGREPEDLPADFVERLRAITSSTCGCFLSSVYVRKGCIELMLDVENAGLEGPADRGLDAGDLVPAAGEANQLEASSSSAPSLASTSPSVAAAAVAASAAQAAQGRTDSSCGGGQHDCLDLTATNGALALAHRVNASVEVGTGASNGSGGSSESVKLSGSSTVVAGTTSEQPPAAAGADAAEAARALDTAAGDAAPPVRRGSAVRAVALGQSSFMALSGGSPAISCVHPRVVEVRADRQRTALTGPENGGDGVGSAAATTASSDRDTVVGSSSEAHRQAAAAAAAGPAVRQWHEPTGAITLYVELSTPPYVPSSALVPQPAASATSAASFASPAAAAVASPLTSAAAISPGGPLIELLVRCNGRYIPVHIQLAEPVKPAVVEASDRHDDAPPPDITTAAGGSCGGGATLTQSYLVTLLEPPSPAAGVLLVDLRWHGRPAQVIPVVLLDEQDEQLLAELSAVVATWTGPPYELDGLLYDLGAWLHCMAVRRAADRVAVMTAGARTGMLHARVAAVTAAAAGGGGLERREPPYLPVLGASLLQFAHAQGLMAMTARLQMDMRGCGYTAHFRPLLRGLMPDSLPPQLQPLAVPLQPMGHQTTAAATAADGAARAAAATASADIAYSTAGGIHDESACSAPSDSAGQAAQAPPERLCSTADEGSIAATVSCLDGRLAAPGALACAAGVRLSAAPQDALALRNVNAEPPPPAILRQRQWRRVSEALFLTRPFCRRHGAAAMAAAQDEQSYKAFAETHGAAVSCLLHLLDILGFLELLLQLVLSMHTERRGGGGTAAAALLRLPPPLLLFFTLTALPSALVAAAWLLLPAPAWRRVAPAARLVRHACLAAGRLVSLSQSGGLPAAACRFYQGCNLGPGALVMEGVVVPAACLLSPAAALLLAALKLPIYVAAGSKVAGAAAGAAAKATATTVAASRCATLDGCAAAVEGRLGGGALLAEAVFRALAVTATALVTTLTCHAYLRLRFQKQQQEEEDMRKGGGGRAAGKGAMGAA